MATKGQTHAKRDRERTLKEQRDRERAKRPTRLLNTHQAMRPSSVATAARQQPRPSRRPQGLSGSSES
jgi:hypothetical protein